MPAGIVHLDRRRLRMLPTRHGLAFALALLVMLLTAVNYNNSLAYGFTFLLGAVALVSMLFTHRNLTGLTLTAGDAVAVFCGETARFAARVSNPTPLERSGLWLMADDQTQPFGLAPHDQHLLQIALATHRRGWLACPSLALASDYPFGLLYSWSRPFTPSASALVYPLPAGNEPLPDSPGGAGDYPPADGAHGDDFIGLRDFRPGDTPQRVHWKAAARTGTLYTKLFGGAAGISVWLDFHAVRASGTEARLSQLCRWVLAADAAGLNYGLRLPHHRLPPAHGAAHRHRCLEALALCDSAPPVNRSGRA